MNPPFVRSPYNYDVTQASEEAAYVETMPSLTVQSMTEDSDLNIMMQRFGVTGKMPEDVRLPTYGDYTDVGDFHSANQALLQAHENFMKFPAEIRSQFDNNPQHFLEFVSNPANIEQTKKWFPKENFNAGSSTAGTHASSSSSATAPGGAGATPSDGGTVSAERPNEQSR